MSLSRFLGYARFLMRSNVKIVYNLNPMLTSCINDQRFGYCDGPALPGSGAGKGGGAGGTVKESGGSLGRYATAQEEEYFYAQNKANLEKLKKKLKSDEFSPEKTDDPPKK